MPNEAAVSDAVEATSINEAIAEQVAPLAMQEFGVTGLRRTGGVVTEEYNPALRGIRGTRTFTEMYDNDPIASGMIFAITRILARLPWEIQVSPDADCVQDEVAFAFIESAFDDMSTGWADILEDILSMAQYGWSYMEVNYKLRQGPDAAEGWQRSKFTDNLIGWRSMKIRAQDTLIQWQFDEHGDIAAMTQLDPNGGPSRTIPLAKSLLFRTSTYKDNPEGRSLLRGAYRPWFYKKRIEDFEAIGVERDLAGLPKAYLPPEYFSPNATDDVKATLRAMQQTVADIRNDSKAGLVIPRAYDANGHIVMDVELMASPGAKQSDTNGIIVRKSNEMAMSILTDFMMLGHEAVGSFALGTAKIDLWTMAVEAVARSIADVFNKHAIEQLLRWNGMTVRHPPRLVFGQVSQVDLPTLGNFIKDMVAAGVLTPGPELDQYVRDAANIPNEVTDHDESITGYTGTVQFDAPPLNVGTADDTTDLGAAQPYPTVPPTPPQPAVVNPPAPGGTAG